MMKKNLNILKTLLLLMFLAGIPSSVWADVTISSVSDWNTFATSVSNGNTYSGETVYLNADISVTTIHSSQQRMLCKAYCRLPSVIFLQ